MLEQPTSDGSVSKFHQSFAVLYNHRTFGLSSPSGTIKPGLYATIHFSFFLIDFTSSLDLRKRNKSNQIQQNPVPITNSQHDESSEDHCSEHE